MQYVKTRQKYMKKYLLIVGDRRRSPTSADTDTMIIPPTPAMLPINIDPANTPPNNNVNPTMQPTTAEDRQQLPTLIQ